MAEEKKPAAKPAAKSPPQSLRQQKTGEKAAKRCEGSRCQGCPCRRQRLLLRLPQKLRPSRSREGTCCQSPAAKAVPAAKAEAAPPAARRKEGPAAAKKPAAKKAPVKRCRPGVVKLHHLRPAPGAKKAKTRVGRGEASKGKTAGRGTKGTQARYQVRPGFEGGQLTSVMRTPKLRGFTNPFRVEYQVVNVGRLSELYPKGGDVTIADLVAKGAVRKNEKVKVLADGDLSVALTVSVDKVSKQAAEKIVKAGGSVEE